MAAPSASADTSTGAGAVYAPRLNAAELRVAADALELAAAAADGRGRDIEAACEEIAGTGFGGEVAAQGLSGFAWWAGRIFAVAALLRHGAQILRSSASAQEALDRLALLALTLRHAESVRYLNALSALLDRDTAAALEALAGGGAPTLADQPGVPLGTIDARVAETLPAATVETVRAAGGYILESGPGGTTVLIGADNGENTDPSRVITMVAGVSTGRPDQLAGELSKARGIAAATGATVVVWQGYAPPPSVVHGIDPTAAGIGGPALSRFQSALRQRYPNAQLTVVAHSYGTVVADRAARETGLDVDDLWLLGSPGMGASGVDKLVLVGDDPQVYVADADRDPILATRYLSDAAHGYSPSDESFGATVVRGVRGDHGAYFTDPVLLRALEDAGRR
ncbi:alpha/beta hydrolase [Corynebacterium liangguodongii]|uniref:DUF1023 domain-containing protein n=1 Tax=Corynebacterium liangguodongii TaxID=2079535 RepID=A0A2S0WG67_9CORY|nr:alpha/beta hydrolase [Corynebacterium liangguodongii]AWB84726.1 hypothetical protein C3E79_09770 [Corynebacterium liangguodongii]PWB99734.1 hypothetical protein DF219_05550 [Corynebacterium liangguodongii]